jgi:hypothetical protein
MQNSDVGPSHSYQQHTNGPVTVRYPDGTDIIVCQTLKLFQRFPARGPRVVPKE